MIKDPSKLNHYDYLNQLLNRDKKNLISANTKITSALLEEIANMKNTFPSEDPLTEENLEKLNQILHDLATAETQKAYNKSLQTIQLKINNDAGVSLVPTVPPSQILEEFNAFVAEEVKQKKHSLEDFRSDLQPGPPQILVLYFPDSESAQRFIDQLFKKNLATLPDGSQDMQQVKDLFSQRAMKRQLNNLTTANLTPPALTPPKAASEKPNNALGSDAPEPDAHAPASPGT